MVLSGVCRYDLGEELSTTRGYRLIVPDWSRFSDDYPHHEDPLHGEHDHLIRMLKRYFDDKGLQTDWSVLERLSTVSLMNSMSMALPISEQDKQVLLETVEPGQRLHTFTSLLGNGFQAPGSVTRH
jgi:Lon protease-like protein